MLPTLNKKATATFAKLLDGLERVGDHRTIDNSNGTYMPVHVDIIGKPDFPTNLPLRSDAKLVSVAHYFKQEGDMCADPDVVFLVTKEVVVPMTFQQAIPPIYQVAVEIEGGKILIHERAAKSLVRFCNQWLGINIAAQQHL